MTLNKIKKIGRIFGLTSTQLLILLGIATTSHAGSDVDKLFDKFDQVRPKSEGSKDLRANSAKSSASAQRAEKKKKASHKKDESVQVAENATHAGDRSPAASVDQSPKAEAAPAAPAQAPAAPQKSEPAAEQKAEAPATAPAPQGEGNAPQGEKEYGLTGDWGGFRNKLGDHGLDFSVVYKGEYGKVLSGGVAQESSLLSNLDIKLLMDAERLFGAKGLSALVYGIGDWGASSQKVPTAHVGDVQGTSNIETPVDNFKLYEAWVQQQFADGKASVLLGIHDLNSEFYVTDASTLFLNSSLGVGKELSQSGTSGPSIFPYTTGAIRLRFEPTPSFALQTAIFNAQAGDPEDTTATHFAFKGSEGFLLINEMDYTPSSESPTRYGVGYWTYTRTFDHTSDTLTNGDGETVAKQATSSGVYLLANQSITKSITAFARYGTATTEALAVKANLAGGLVFTGLLGFRPDDKLGAAFTQVTSATDGLPAETAYEFIYRAEIGHGVAIMPDLQYVQNPEFGANVSNATIGSVRLEIGL